MQVSIQQVQPPGQRFLYRPAFSSELQTIGPRVCFLIRPNKTIERSESPRLTLSLSLSLSLSSSVFLCLRRDRLRRVFKSMRSQRNPHPSQWLPLSLSSLQLNPLCALPEPSSPSLSLSFFLSLSFSLSLSLSLSLSFKRAHSAAVLFVSSVFLRCSRGSRSGNTGSDARPSSLFKTIDSRKQRHSQLFVLAGHLAASGEENDWTRWTFSRCVDDYFYRRAASNNPAPRSLRGFVASAWNPLSRRWRFSSSFEAALSPPRDNFYAI